MRRPCVIFNPTARGERARRFQRHLEQMGAGCVLKPTVGIGSARALAAAAVREEHETIVAAGGDGTVNEVLNGISDVPDGWRQARLGILPLGTINVFAKQCGIPADLKLAWNVLSSGEEHVIDLGVATFQDGAVVQRRRFAQLAGAGLDSRAIHLVSWNLKKTAGPVAYMVSGLQALRERQAEITVSNGIQSVSGQLVLIGNGRFYGGKFVLFPEASNTDGLLDACIFSRVHWSHLPRRAWGLLRQTLPAQGGVAHLQGHSLQLTSTSSVQFQVEGENVGLLPVTFSVEPKTLRVIVPKPVR
jgi:YegS/Rv2252/BmrU family lipid kinase